MSDPNPYELLGVPESASFEEIQAVRDRLLQASADDSRKASQIEAAYDSVLMQRLKLRQEGKIKVPDGIRFAEKTPTAQPKLAMPNLPDGLSANRIFSLPAVTEIVIPTVAAIALGASAALAPRPDVFQLVALAATAGAMFITYQKERNLLRTVLVGFGGLIAGYMFGLLIFSVIPAEFRAMIPGGLLSADVFVTWCVCLVLWLLSLFIK